MKILAIPALLPLVLLAGCSSGPTEARVSAQQIEVSKTAEVNVGQNVPDASVSPTIQETVVAQSTALARLDATVTALAPDVSRPLPQASATIIPLPPQKNQATVTATLSAALEPAAAVDLARYVHPSGLWSVQYPHRLLQREGLTDNIIIFISEDRTTFAAVDTYQPEGDEYGQAGEGLQARAQKTLNQIYGKQVTLTGTQPTLQEPWEVGVSFTTDLGSIGQAVYTQRGRSEGDYRVYGFLYGHKQGLDSMMRPMLEAVKASLIFRG